MVNLEDREEQAGKCKSLPNARRWCRGPAQKRGHVIDGKWTM